MISMRLIRLIAISLVGALIAGCKTAPSSPASQGAASASRPSAQAQQSPPNAATKAAATKANLAIEKLRLTELFRGTPVLFALQPDGNLRVDVPLQFSFETGKAAVKPPLAAVLDHIANGQRNELTQLVVRTPADPAVKGGTLVGERSASVHDYLVAHGLADARVTVAAPAGVAVVRIVVADASPP